MTAIGIVCGYDLHADLDRYVASVARQLEHEQLDAVILSGGHTSPVSHHSEAWVMAEALRKRMPALPLILEECSMTTLDNLTFANEMARSCFDAIERFVVFCDVAHERKVRLLSSIVLRTRASTRAHPRTVPLRIRLFEPLSIFCEIVAAFSPRIQRMIRHAAVRLKGLSAEQRHSVLQAAASSAASQHHPTRRFDRAVGRVPHPLPPRA